MSRKFTSKEVIKILGVTEQGLQKWIYKGIYIYTDYKTKTRRKLIPSVMASGSGSRYYFTYSDFEKFFDDSRKERYKLGLMEMKAIEENDSEFENEDLKKTNKEYWLKRLEEATELMQLCISELRKWD